jgi:hypothetical protein
MGEVGRIAHNVAEISETVATQGRRVDEVVAATTATVRDTTDYLGRAARKTVLPLVEIGALWQGAKRAFRVYRSLRPSPRRREREPEPASLAAPPAEFAGPYDMWTERQT